MIMNEDNNVITMDCESVAVLLQKMRKESKWLSDFFRKVTVRHWMGKRYLTDKEVAELLRVSRRTLQEYRNNRILPFDPAGRKRCFIRNRELREVFGSKL